MVEHINHEVAAEDRTMFGFWIYLMTDLIMFSVLFAVYIVLQGNTLGGETGRDLFNLPMVLVATLLLLTSSLTCGIGMIAARRHDKAQTLLWFGVTFVLGALFLALSMQEFAELVHEGQTLQTNAFTSAFFVLVGTHAIHIMAGLLWLAVTLGYIVKRGLNGHMVRKLALISLFWHFLDIVWIFVFTIVYLGAFV